MYLTVSTGTTVVTGAQTALMGRVEKSIYGNLPVQNICVSQESLQDGSVTIKPVLECLNEVAPDQTTIFIAFTFIDGGDAAGLEHYLKARAPALAKHGGKVLLSATSERGRDWDFDGVEIIQFPQPDSVAELMQDADYTENVSDAAAIFDKDFAMVSLLLR